MASDSQGQGSLAVMLLAGTIIRAGSSRGQLTCPPP
jgi:hypothetical protein